MHEFSLEDVERFKANRHLSNVKLGKLFGHSHYWARWKRVKLGVPPSTVTAGPAPRPSMWMPLIIRTVAAHSAMTVNDMLAERRERELVRARHICMWIAHREFDYSLVTIAKAMRRADHTTVLHGVRKLEEPENHRTLAFAKDIAKSIRKEIKDERFSHATDPGRDVGGGDLSGVSGPRVLNGAC